MIGVILNESFFTAAPTETVVNVYMMWDETYLYIANEVTDANKGRLVYGGDGDNLVIMLDVNYVLAELQAAYDRGEVTFPDNNYEGYLNMSNFKLTCFPVANAVNDASAPGFQTQYNGVTHEHGGMTPTDIVDTGYSENGNTWVIEQRVKWTDLAANLAAVYSTYGIQFPQTIGEGTVLTFMTSYHDCVENNVWKGWYIGQNKLIATAAACPLFYGFKGTLGAKPSADTSDATLTAGIVVSAVALAGVTVVLSKKKH